MNCKTAAELYSQSLDANLSLKKRIGVRFHHFLCSMCKRYCRQMKILQAVITRYRQRLVEDVLVSKEALSDDARQRISQALHDEMQDR